MTSPPDLTQCDREPIHIPGAIQPHGALIAARAADLRVIVVSANLATHCGLEPDAVLGHPLATALGPEIAAQIRELVDARTWIEHNPLAIDAFGRRFDGVLHVHQDAVILELEPAAAPPDVTRALRGALHALQRLDSIDTLCNQVVQQVRALTGFERVMLYRFDEEGHGSVEAEDRLAALEPYLGLHYPASDIPKQARELYRKNWLRIIHDARYTPVPLLPDTGTPLDLSFAVLRSVSPVHLEYLANMGVRASMSISLVVHDRLWGLISCCHHSGPHAVPYATRNACEVIGRLCSLQIAALEERELTRKRDARADGQRQLAEALRLPAPDDDLLCGLLHHPELLLQHVRATGVAVVLQDGRVAVRGSCPSEARIRAIHAWLGARGATAPFATDMLARELPDASDTSDTSCGLLVLTIHGEPARRVMWFRPEHARTVSWGGDPHKPVEADASARIHPRRSFALWQEEVRLRSEPWSTADVEAAEDLRRIIVGIDLERQFDRAVHAVRVRDDMVAVVSHDLRSPLNVIAMSAHLLQATRPAGALERDVVAIASRIDRAASYMTSLIADLLDLTKLQAGELVLQRAQHDVGRLVEQAAEMMRPLAEAKQIDLRCAAPPCALLSLDHDRIFQTLTNLLGNAIKFTPEGGRVEITLTAAADHVLIRVIDTGQGIATSDLPHVFDRYWQSRKSGRESAGLGLFIAKGIVEAHGGRIWVESELQRGSQFSVWLPSRRGDDPDA